MGKRFETDDPDKAEEIIRKEGSPVVVIIPGPSLFADPSEWVKALLPASYAVVMGDEKEKYLKDFMKRLDRQVFSPIPKKLAGAVCINDEKEAGDIVLGLSSGKKGFVTIVVR